MKIIFEDNEMGYIDNHQYIIIERFIKELIHKNPDAKASCFNASELFNRFVQTKLYSNFYCLNIDETTFITGLKKLSNSNSVLLS